MPFYLDGKETSVRVLKDTFTWNDDVLSWVSGPKPGSKFLINGRTISYHEEETKDNNEKTKSE